MSVTYHMYCKECKEMIQVGQNRHVYYGEDMTKELSKFLHKHKGHDLLFESEDYSFDNWNQWKKWEW